MRATRTRTRTFTTTAVAGLTVALGAAGCTMPTDPPSPPVTTPGADMTGAPGEDRYTAYRTVPPTAPS